MLGTKYFLVFLFTIGQCFANPYFPGWLRKKIFVHPQQIHLSLGKEPSTMVATWVTAEKTDGGLFTRGSYCLYGDSIKNQTRRAQAESVKFYKTGIESEDGATIYTHRALLTDLEPDTIYCKYKK